MCMTHSLCLCFLLFSALPWTAWLKLIPALPTPQHSYRLPCLIFPQSTDHLTCYVFYFFPSCPFISAHYGVYNVSIEKLILLFLLMVLSSVPRTGQALTYLWKIGKARLPGIELFSIGAKPNLLYCAPWCWGTLQTTCVFHSWLLPGLFQKGVVEGLEEEEGTCFFLFTPYGAFFYLFLWASP